ncbi:DNA cytosine methyltransferase [Methanoculleus oceani]|uniref:DNA (cytosine-5-)-methyltransferase n=1 Tax=Methanoculleus oceani TaxID=2184756 RepID=A0ABD4TBQ1_9EURY|nr:DNA cytosine methyltransferase [Methanoculleus sp. CWC-02]MCM2464762.1 cytosine methyltransferase [Methanoculleus sp. CWC-02]
MHVVEESVVDAVNHNKRNRPQIVDLFSGAGGLSIGAARAGFIVRGAVENDPIAFGTHKCNFPNTIHISTSVSDLTGEKLLDLLKLKSGSLTGVIGGPPCQGFSSMGRKDKNDPRNRLFPEFFRIVAETHPKFFLAENVPGILCKENSDIINEGLSFVEDKYVFLPPLVVKANEYGVATTRTRIFFFGYHRDKMEPLTANDFLPSSDIEKIFVKDALRGLPIKINPEWQKEEQSWQIVRTSGNGYYASRLQGHVPPGVGDPVALSRLRDESLVSGFLGTRHSDEVVQRYAKVEFGRRDPISRATRLDPEGFCPTLRAGTGRDHGSHQALRPIHPTENRAITPREAARLQGFPDWFRFAPTKWHSFRQIGSSVSPIVAERLLAVVRNAI